MKIKSIEEEKVDYRESYNKAWCRGLEAMCEGEIDESLLKEMFEPIPEHQVTAAQDLFSKLESLESKRIHPKLTGETKAKFENEFNTLKQVLNMLAWPGNQIVYAKRYALLWAAWGAYHLKDIGKIEESENIDAKI